eukprot:TRINITY_DN60857_c0_g1_i1.p1 TRINITY_DN60857_c0_g1~~TRINITY_DN60857_c0_g1_i1.p1  ORF type:complete len:712 (+),score=133.88 TRINITY_DN60857_c0_g1_i1:108-2138(+)
MLALPAPPAQRPQTRGSVQTAAGALTPSLAPQEPPGAPRRAPKASRLHSAPRIPQRASDAAVSDIWRRRYAASARRLESARAAGLRLSARPQGVRVVQLLPENPGAGTENAEDEQVHSEWAQRRRGLDTEYNATFDKMRSEMKRLDEQMQTSSEPTRRTYLTSLQPRAAEIRAQLMLSSAERDEQEAGTVQLARAEEGKVSAFIRTQLQRMSAMDPNGWLGLLWHSVRAARSAPLVEQSVAQRLAAVEAALSHRDPVAQLPGQGGDTGVGGKLGDARGGARGPSAAVLASLDGEADGSSGAHRYTARPTASKFTQTSTAAPQPDGDSPAPVSPSPRGARQRLSLIPAKEEQAESDGSGAAEPSGGGGRRKSSVVQLAGGDGDGADDINRSSRLKKAVKLSTIASPRSSPGPGAALDWMTMNEQELRAAAQEQQEQIAALSQTLILLHTSCAALAGLLKRFLESHVQGPGASDALKEEELITMWMQGSCEPGGSSGIGGRKRFPAAPSSPSSVASFKELLSDASPVTEDIAQRSTEQLSRSAVAHLSRCVNMISRFVRVARTGRRGTLSYADVDSAGGRSPPDTHELVPPAAVAAGPRGSIFGGGLQTRKQSVSVRSPRSVSRRGSGSFRRASSAFAEDTGDAQQIQSPSHRASVSPRRSSFNRKGSSSLRRGSRAG